MKDIVITGRIIRQGRALVRAIEGISEIEPTGPVERFITWLLTSYKQRLRAIVAGAPNWMIAEILSVGRRERDGSVVWISKN